MAEEKIKVIADNRKARFDYFILETYEAGIELTGTEVKSLRAGRINLKDSYAQVVDGQLFLEGVHISPYEQGNRYNVDPLRKRRLLMHKREILKLFGQVKQEGLTLVPLKWNWPCAKAKSFTTSGTARRKRTPGARSSGPSGAAADP